MVIDLKRLLAAKVSGNPIGTQTELSVKESQQVQARDITEVEEDSTREHSLQQSRECERCSECDAHMAVVQKLQAEKEAMEELIAAQVQHCDDSMN
jgi:DNA-directed RNA polymerase subunit M/transcription elongation factor TFIIS